MDTLIGFELNETASPGMPLMLVAQTNAKLVDELRMTLVVLAEARLKLLMDVDHEILRKMSAIELVDAYLVDAVRVFVKQEPHSNEKILQQRMRLISSRGVVDQLVERFLFGRYQNWCISRWRDIPQKPGMGHADDHLKSIWQEVQLQILKGMKPSGTDVSGWDVSMTGEYMDLGTEVPIKLMEPPLVVVNAMKNQTLCMYRSLWCLSNGHLYVQFYDGIMKSGSFRTAELNSTVRAIMAFAITLDLGGSPADCWAITMGDDCCENDFGGYEARKAEYAKQGVRLTDYMSIQLDGEFEFTSHMFRHPGVASLHSWPRTLYRLLMKPFDAAELMQFMYECRYNFELKEILNFLAEVGWIPPHIQVLRQVDHLTLASRVCEDQGTEDLTDNHANRQWWLFQVFFVLVNLTQAAILIPTIWIIQYTWSILARLAWISIDCGCVYLEWFGHEMTVCVVCALPAANLLLTRGLIRRPQNYLRENRNCGSVLMSKAEKRILKEVKEIKKEEKEKKTSGHKMLPASASSTGKQKQKVISRPSSAVGSVKNYGTPYNALNSQLNKFMPSQTQAALMAWAHTVANPRTKNPHPVPLMAAPGASASVPQMYQCTLYGQAAANASGHVFIGANADAWFPSIPGTELPSGEQWPVPANRYLSVPGSWDPDGHPDQGFPVHYTDATYGTGTTAGQGSKYPEHDKYVDGGSDGINFLGLPQDFITNMTQDTRYTCVAVELRARPVQAQLYASGELIAFNYRRTVTGETTPSGAPGFLNKEFGTMLALQDYYLSRERVAAPNWPSNKWLTTVAIPNTTTAFGQWFPLNGGGPISASQNVGYPSVFIMGDGLPSGAPIEFEATYVYAVYGTRTYTTSGNSAAELYVDASRAAPVVANGFTQLVPKAAGSRPDARGVGAVVRAEQADGRMPSVKEVISGVKTAGQVFEAVTGSDIGEEIVGIIGDIAAMFL